MQALVRHAPLAPFGWKDCERYRARAHALSEVLHVPQCKVRDAKKCLYMAWVMAIEILAAPTHTGRSQFANTWERS